MRMQAEAVVQKTVRLNLVGLDGNAFNLLAEFQRAARRQGWTPDEIAAVHNEATRGDYDHLLQVLVRHTEPRPRVSDECGDGYHTACPSALVTCGCECHE